MSLIAQATPETRVLPLPDGRQLGYACYGSETGRAVVYLHGLPGSRYECQLVDPVARALGIRVVAPDRPGYGLTPLQPGRSLRGWTQDVISLADNLGIERFSVIGMSGGAPCALACAHEMPDRVSRIGIVAGLGPVSVSTLRSQMRLTGRGAFYLADNMPWLIRKLFGPPLMQLAQRRSDLLVRLLAALGEGPDRDILLDPTLFPAFTLSIRECFRQGIEGSLNDLRLFRQPWGFRLEDIHQTAHLWHGTRDRIVPLGHSRYMHAQLANSTLTIVPEEGHFSLPLRQMRTIIHTFSA